MKPENILTQIGVTPTPRNKEHARKLVEIYKMLYSIKSDIVSSERKQTDFCFGKETSERDWKLAYESRYVTISGHKVKAEVFTIKTKTGTYTQTIPVNTDLHLAFCDLVGQPKQETEAPILVANFDKEQTRIIKKAVSFCSVDQFKEALTYIRFEFDTDKLKLIASDGHRLLIKYLNVPTGKKINFMVLAKNLKVSGNTFELKIFENHYSVNGQNFKTIKPDDVCPNFDAVWPNGYKGQITVNRNELLKAVKSMLPTANKWTKALRFYFNGAVKIEAENIDFGNESGLSIQYSSPKNCNDFQTGLNAKYLIDALEVNKSETVTILTDGRPDKALLIDNEIMLMPIHIPDYQ